MRRIRWPTHNDTLAEVLIRRYRRLSGDNCDATEISAAGLVALTDLGDEAFIRAVSSALLQRPGECALPEDEGAPPVSASVDAAQPATAPRHAPDHPTVRAVRQTFSLRPDDIALIDAVRSLHREKKQRVTPISQGTVIRALILMLSRMPENERYDLIDSEPELQRGAKKLTHKS